MSSAKMPRLYSLCWQSLPSVSCEERYESPQTEDMPINWSLTVWCYFRSAPCRSRAAMPSWAWNSHNLTQSRYLHVCLLFLTICCANIVMLRGTGSAIFLEKTVSANAPSSHCYGMQQLDSQVNRSSATVGGRKNANAAAYPLETHLKRMRGRNKQGPSEQFTSQRAQYVKQGTCGSQIWVLCWRGSSEAVFTQGALRFIQ